jgi:hypothetical protein
MNPTTEVILWSALTLSWTLIPLIIVQYRLVLVPKRCDEIKNRFPAEGAGMSAALLYARLLNPRANETVAADLPAREFWYFHRWSRYALPLMIVALLSGLMLYFSGLWIIDRLAASPSPSVLGRIPTPFVMALWGAFVWSLYEIWTRRKSSDLTPVEVFEVALRFVIAIPIGYAFSLLVFQTVPSLAAFIASAFPLRDVQRLMRKQALQKLGESAQSSSNRASKGYLGEVLSGIGNETIVRLEELNIETYLDLAYADPIRLMVKTGVPIQLVLAWIDEALLAVYVSDKKDRFDALGMPCALDVREFYRAHALDPATGAEKRDWWRDEAVQHLGKQVDIPCELLPQVLRSISEDPYVEFLDAAWDGSPTVRHPATSSTAPVVPGNERAL